MAAAGERRMRMVFAGGTVTDEIIYAGQTISMNYLPVRDASGTIISGMIMSQNITRRKQTEAALAAERNLLRTLIDSIPDYVYVKDTQSRFVLANQAVLSASGVENIEQLVGTTDFDHLPQAIAQSFYDDDCGVLSSGQPLIDREEASVDLKSGEDLWFSTTKVPLRDENSVVAGLVGVSRDIRQRKQLEATLKLKIEEEQQFQNYLKSLHEITVELTTIDDIDTFYKRAVELGLQRLGFDRLGFLLYEVETGTVLGTYGTDIHGQVVAEHDLRIDPSDLTSILKRALEKEERFAFDASAQLFSNLKLVGVGWNAAAVLWNGTDKLGWLAADNLVRHDPLTTSQLNVLALYAVTLGTLLAQKRSQLAVREREKELRQERDLLRTIIENSPDYISIKDIQGHFILANSALARISNLSVGEMIGKTSFDILSPELAVRFHEDDLRVLQSGEPLVNAERNIGDKVLLATKIPLRDKDGEITGIISLSRDITQHKQLERHKLELESERGRIKVLQRFINDMSHDFRTPLTAINNTLYLLKKNGDPQKQETYIQRAQRHIKRMDDLLEAILQIEYLDKGEIAFQFSWSDMNTFIPPLIQEYAPMSSPKQIVIKFVAEIDQCFALIDRVEFARVITKLLENGITYTPEGGHITFRTGIDQQWAVISIQDTGNGISADDLPHIFERFYRADQARSSDTGGSGLGLSIVQKIIEAHNGRIDVESVLGEGSKFTIRLPIAE